MIIAQQSKPTIVYGTYMNKETCEALIAVYYVLLLAWCLMISKFRQNLLDCANSLQLKTVKL